MPEPAFPPAAFAPASDGQEFLPSAPSQPLADRGSEPIATARSRVPTKVLHIRCPSGHLVKARSDLLGKNGRCPACKKTFELRYEDSVEFQRSKETKPPREETKSGRAWIAWALLAAFLAFAGLIALVIVLSERS